MVWHVDAIVQSVFWGIFRVWHGGSVPKTNTKYQGESLGGVFRERVDVGGCDYAGFGNASSLARYAHCDGRALGAYLWIGGDGGGEILAEAARNVIQSRQTAQF